MCCVVLCCVVSWLRSHANYIVVWQKIGGDDKKRAQHGTLIVIAS